MVHIIWTIWRMVCEHTFHRTIAQGRRKDTFCKDSSVFEPQELHI